MNKYLTNFFGGEPFKLDDIRFNDDSYRDAFNNLLLAWGTDFIVSGCDVASYIVSAGYIMLNGELLKVDSHTIQGAGFFQKQVTYDSNGLKDFKNGNVNNTYQKNRGIAIANSGTLSVNGIRLNELVNINNIITNVTNNITGTTVNKIPVIGSNLSGGTYIMTNSNKKLISVKQAVPVLTQTIININDWDMNLTNQIFIPFSDTSKIRRISILIRQDGDTDINPNRFDLLVPEPSTALGGYYNITSSNNIRLVRINGGFFNNASFNATSFNRGWVIVDQIP